MDGGRAEQIFLLTVLYSSVKIWVDGATHYKPRINPGGFVQLRDYQRIAVDHAAEWHAFASPGDKLLLAAPTGTGKSVIELALQSRIPGAWIVTPRLEIVAGMVQKAGGPGALSEAAMIAEGWGRHITTPIRLRSALMRGDLPAPPALIFDEAHHDLAASWQDISLLCGFSPAIGLTATPYRGTPRGTAEFRRQWGEPVWVITFPEAAAGGYLSMPECRTVPLVDDDLIELRGGELVAAQVDSAVGDRISAIAELCPAWFAGAWDRPTMFALPSRDTCRVLQAALGRHGIPAVVVDGETPYSERQEAFRAVLDRSAALIQVQVVSEGVDLPIRRLVDCSPSISPVRWLQQFGRITRPGGQSEYVCTNRNLLRHGYLLDGLLPLSSIKEAQEAFAGPGKRAAVRAVGLEALGRLKATEIPIAGGITGLGYAISALEGHRRTEYFCLLHPAWEEPIWAARENNPGAYGRWSRCAPPEDLSGFASLAPSAVSEKQRAWWERSAGAFGLDPTAEVTRKQFQVLPVLSDLKVRL